MAERAYIPQYFLYGGADEAVGILMALRRDEEEFSQGIEHVLRRVEGWINKLSTLDPFWDLRIDRDSAGRYSITPVEKNAGPAKDRAITIRVETQFPNTPQGRSALEGLQAAIEYGRPATVSKDHVTTLEVDAPAGMGGPFTEGFAISPGEKPEFQVDMTMTAMAPDGQPLASLPIRFD